MPLSPGDRLGSHEIIALLGAGGMGEVYRARDTKLSCAVAVKVLPEAFASDADRRLDLAHGELTGDPVRLADQVGFDTILGGFSASADGSVAYRVGGGESRQLTWFDRAGKAVSVAGDPDTNDIQYPELSPDGRRVAASRTVQGNRDIWLMDLLRAGLTRLNFDGGQDVDPVWSPDGMRTAFASSRKGVYHLYVKASNGAGDEEVLLETPNSKITQDWSKDGRFLMYYEVDPRTGRDLCALEMAGNDPKPRVIANTAFEEALGQFCPDGR